MNNRAFLGLALGSAALCLVAGFHLGTGHWPTMADVHGPVAMDQPAKPEMAKPQERTVLYWRDPDGKPSYSIARLKTEDGRSFVPVFDNAEPDFPEDKGAGAPAAMAMAKDGPKKIKYYRNPMGLPDTSPTPKKDSMNMDYLPVYVGEDEDNGSGFKISLAKVQRAGVRSEPVAMRQLARPVRAPGTAKIDDRTIREVTMRADGFVEKLYVAEMGKHVKAGEPLFRIYSPDIVKAEVDYKIAREATASKTRGDVERDLAGAEMRLTNLDVPDSLIKTLRSGKEPMPMKIDWPSPVSGVVIEKKVVEGQKVKAGDMLYQIADLSKIWVIADVSEQDMGQIKVGDPAQVVFRAYTNETFTGKVTFILHELDMKTRTGKVRIEVANPDHRIRHEMFADVTIDTGSGDGQMLAVPVSAVLDTGSRQVVLVDKGEGRFEPRPVKLGQRGDGYVEVKDGLAVGDNVVVTANFLLDAESNLKAALKGFTPDAPAQPEGDAPQPPNKDRMRPATAEAKP